MSTTLILSYILINIVIAIFVDRPSAINKKIFLSISSFTSWLMLILLYVYREMTTFDLKIFGAEINFFNPFLGHGSSILFLTGLLFTTFIILVKQDILEKDTYLKYMVLINCIFPLFICAKDFSYFVLLFFPIAICLIDSRAVFFQNKIHKGVLLYFFTLISFLIYNLGIINSGLDLHSSWVLEATMGLLLLIGGVTGLRVVAEDLRTEKISLIFYNLLGFFILPCVLKYRLSIDISLNFFILLAFILGISFVLYKEIFKDSGSKAVLLKIFLLILGIAPILLGFNKSLSFELLLFVAFVSLIFIKSSSFNESLNVYKVDTLNKWSMLGFIFFTITFSLSSVITLFQGIYVLVGTNFELIYFGILMAIMFTFFWFGYLLRATGTFVELLKSGLRQSILFEKNGVILFMISLILGISIFSAGTNIPGWKDELWISNFELRTFGISSLISVLAIGLSLFLIKKFGNVLELINRLNIFLFRLPRPNDFGQFSLLFNGSSGEKLFSPFFVLMEYIGTTLSGLFDERKKTLNLVFFLLCLFSILGVMFWQ